MNEEHQKHHTAIQQLMEKAINRLDKIIWKHMTKERYLELTRSKDTDPNRLTEEEQKEWHFCKSWKGLLIHTGDPTYSECNCGFKRSKESSAQGTKEANPKADSSTKV